MSDTIKIIEQTKYAHKYISLKPLPEKQYASFVAIPSRENNLTNSLYDITYSELKESIAKDFDKKVERVHAKYEALILDTIFNTLENLDTEIVDLNQKLSKTIVELTKSE
jgi:hypothetical protein